MAKLKIRLCEISSPLLLVNIFEIKIPNFLVDWFIHLLVRMKIDKDIITTENYYKISQLNTPLLKQ